MSAPAVPLPTPPPQGVINALGALVPQLGGMPLEQVALSAQPGPQLQVHVWRRLPNQPEQFLSSLSFPTPDYCVVDGAPTQSAKVSPQQAKEVHSWAMSMIPAQYGGGGGGGGGDQYKGYPPPAAPSQPYPPQGYPPQGSSGYPMQQAAAPAAVAAPAAAPEERGYKKWICLACCLYCCCCDDCDDCCCL